MSASHHSREIDPPLTQKLHSIYSAYKTSLHHTMTEDRCFICLGDGAENPYIQHPDLLIKPCSCSLRSHTGCLVNWLMEVLMSDSKVFSQIPSREEREAQMSDVGIRPRRCFYTRGKNQKVNVFVECPQCKSFICYQSPSFGFLTKTFRHCKGIAVSLSKLFVMSGILSSGLSTLIIGATTVSSSVGFGILNTLVPASVQLRLFNVKYHHSSLIDAIDKNHLNPVTWIRSTALIPIYLMSLRTSYFKINLNSELFNILFPFFFVEKEDVQPSNDIFSKNIPLWSSPKRFLFFIAPFKFAYSLLFGLTLNRMYYRWFMRGLPFFVQLSTYELGNLEKEIDTQRETFALQEEEQICLQKKYAPVGVFQKVKNYLFPPQELRKIALKRRLFELKNCLCFDYSKPFQTYNRYLHIVISLLFPLAGKVISGRLLSKVGWLTLIINRVVKTPDENIFVRNLIGCAVAVVVKDLFLLLESSLRVSTYKSVYIIPKGDPLYQEALGG